MPWPVSVTRSCVLVPARTSSTSTLPSRGVNFTALLTRFHTTCCRRSGSPSTKSGSPLLWNPTWIDLACAAGPAVSIAARVTSARSM